MATGIGLGLPDSPASLDNVRYYAIEPRGEGIAWDRLPANPFAAKVDSSGPYDRVDSFNDWVQEDWQAGVGRVDATTGGFLYAETETRVPNQIILPPLLQQCDLRTIAGTITDCRFMPSSISGAITVGSGGSYDRVAMSFTTPASWGPPTNVSVCFFAQIPFGVEVTVAVYSNSSSKPNTLVTSTTVEGDAPDQLFQWYGDQFSASSLADSTTYWAVIYPTSTDDTIEVAYAASGYAAAAQGYASSTWSAISSKYVLFTTDVFRTPLNSGLNSHFIRFNNVLYMVSERKMWKYDSANEQFDLVGSIPGSGDIHSVEVFGPTLWIGRAAGNFAKMNTSETLSDGGANGQLFLQFKGLLYRSYQNDLYYSADGSTWIGPFQPGGDDITIRGLAGLGDSVYCATDKALVRFAPGNVMEEVSRFGTESTGNGTNMIEHQGSLYIPANGRIYRMDASGQLQDIWVSRDDDLPASRIGTVSNLARMNNWLVAFVVPRSTGGRPSVWVYQDEGWHFLVSVVAGASQGANIGEQHGLYYDRGTARVWMNFGGVWTQFVKVDDYAINPYNLSNYLYQPYGWLEQDRFYGGQTLLDKSWESVTIHGDNISTTTSIDVFFQDEASTGWESLGTVTSDGQELRWNDYSERPAGKWVKIGVRLSTTDGDETPRVRAIVVKYLPYPNDRIRDTVILTLKDNIELTGGVSTYTLAQQRTHVENMIAQVDPFIYVDPFGESYEVTLIDWSMSASKWSAAGAVTELRVMLTVEQVPNSKYLS